MAKISLSRTDKTDRPSFGTTLFEIAKTMAERSTCPSGARHGAILVDQERNIISTGYGSPARGVDPCTECWLRKKYKETGVKDFSVCPAVHAEANAIMNAARNGVSTKGAIMYTTKGLCDGCRRLCVNAGIQSYMTLEKVEGMETWVLRPIWQTQ